MIDLLELAINRVLGHDPRTQQRLAELSGKNLALEITSLGQTLYISSCPEGIELSHQAPDIIDVSLSTSLPALIKISRKGLENVELKSGELSISGDPILGQKFATIIAELDIDWSGVLEDQFGESLAGAISANATHGKQFAQHSKSYLQQSLKQFLQQQQIIVSDPQVVEHFCDSVDTLKADAEQLAIRLQNIQNKLNP